MNSDAVVSFERTTLPLIALRGLTAMPGARIQFDIARKRSLKAVEAAMNGDRRIILVAQKDIRTENPGFTDVYRVGTVGKVSQFLKMHGDNAKVVVEGVQRVLINSFTGKESYIEAEADILEIEDIPVTDPACEAYVRRTVELMGDYAAFFPKISDEVMYNVMAAAHAGALADYVAANMPFKYESKQDLLESFAPFDRISSLILMLSREIEVLELEQSIAEKVRLQMDKGQKEYYLREQLKVISEELGDGDNPMAEADEYRKRIKSLSLPGEIEEKLLKEADRLSKMPFGSHEGSVIRIYLDTVLELPFNIRTKDRFSVQAAEKLLDREHYGLKKVKERILEYIAVRALSPDINGQIICLAGPPGVGKTSIAASIAKALGRKYARVSLGGVKDEAEIRGHRKTYIGAMPGRIVKAVKQAGSMNPLILLDEVDKLGYDYKGDPSSALLEVLDPEQNKTFTDHFLEFPFDLSQVLFVTTANSLEYIPAPLLDRMEVIELGSYTVNEKREIARRHLIPKQLKRHGMTREQFKISGPALNELIDGYTREAGVRELEREIAALIRKAAKKIVSGEAKTVSLTPSNLEETAGTRKFKKDITPREPETGIATGLAYTQAGGEVLFIEVNVMDGSGKVELTGSLGDIMKESCHAAVSYIRANSRRLAIDSDFYKTKDIHIHFPEGAVPKDGPSAGITITSALISQLSGIPVRTDTAMTGEITLRGKVLPIGGLKEKTMAAYKNGVKRVIIPADNLPDLDNIDQEVRKNLEFIPASSIETVLENVLVASPFVAPQRPEAKTLILTDTAKSPSRLPGV